jgi:hypothetical protein
MQIEITASTIQPATIAGASIVIQTCLLFIAFGTLWLLSKSYTARAAAKNSYSALVAWLLATLIVLLLGEDLYATWGPILGRISIPNVPRDYSFFAVFVLDIVFATVLILRTGGAKKSPFTSILFLLPSLAIFLREPVGRFLFYSLAVGFVYVVLLRKSLRTLHADFDRSEYDAPTKADEAVDDKATVWANISCLTLATIIGYITQPL